MLLISNCNVKSLKHEAEFYGITPLGEYMYVCMCVCLSVSVPVWVCVHMCVRMWSELKIPVNHRPFSTQFSLWPNKVQLLYIFNGRVTVNL